MVLSLGFCGSLDSSSTVLMLLLSCAVPFERQLSLGRVGNVCSPTSSAAASAISDVLRSCQAWPPCARESPPAVLQYCCLPSQLLLASFLGGSSRELLLTVSLLALSLSLFLALLAPVLGTFFCPCCFSFSFVLPSCHLLMTSLATSCPGFRVPDELDCFCFCSSNQYCGDDHRDCSDHCMWRPLLVDPVLHGLRLRHFFVGIFLPKITFFVFFTFPGQ